LSVDLAFAKCKKPPLETRASRYLSVDELFGHGEFPADSSERDPEIVRKISAANSYETDGKFDRNFFEL